MDNLYKDINYDLLYLSLKIVPIVNKLKNKELIIF